MATSKLRDTDADALLRAFYREEIRDECAVSQELPHTATLHGQVALPAMARSAARKARRVEMLAACALIALVLSPALYDPTEAPLASKAAIALRLGADHPLLKDLGAGAARLVRAYSQSYPSRLMRAP